MKRTRHRCLYLLIMCYPLHAMEKGGDGHQHQQSPESDRCAQTFELLLHTAKDPAEGNSNLVNRPPTPIPPHTTLSRMRSWHGVLDNPQISPLTLTPTSRRRQLLERAREKSSAVKAQYDTYETGLPKEKSRSSSNLSQSMLMARAASSHGSNPDLLELLLREEQSTGPEGWPGIE